MGRSGMPSISILANVVEHHNFSPSRMPLGGPDKPADGLCSDLWTVERAEAAGPRGMALLTRKLSLSMPCCKCLMR